MALLKSLYILFLTQSVTGYYLNPRSADSLPNGVAIRERSAEAKAPYHFNAPSGTACSLDPKKDDQGQDGDPKNRPKPPKSSPTPSPVTCESTYECPDVGKNIQIGCKEYCVCSDHTTHFSPKGGCDDFTKQKRAEALAARNSIDTKPGKSQLNVLEARALTFEQAKCKGEKLLNEWDDIGKAPIPDMSEWTTAEKDSPGGLIDEIAKREGIDYKKCKLSTAQLVKDGGYTSYENIFCEDGIVIAYGNFRAREGNPYHWSDVVAWYANKNNFKIRTVWRNEVSNSDTVSILDHILDGKDSATFTMDDDNGKAFLGTPNGIGIGYLGAQHGPEVGERKPSGGEVFTEDGSHFAKISF